MSVPAKKMRVEVFDELGNRYTITFEGRVTRDKALRIFDMVELLGGMPTVQPQLEHGNLLSKVDKVRHIIERQFPVTWFNANEVKSTYEGELGESIGMSTVCTYLSRLADRGLLLKNRRSKKVQYRLVTAQFKGMLDVKEIR